MPFKLINPHWKDPVAQKAEQHAAAVQDWLRANAGNRAVTLAELRTGLPAIAADLTRPVVAEIARRIGAQVEGTESADA